MLPNEQASPVQPRAYISRTIGRLAISTTAYLLQSYHCTIQRRNYSASMSSNPYAAAHASPAGPGDSRPTAAQIIIGNDLVGALHGKAMLVTGGSNGLGVDVVRQLAKTGAKVFFTSRDIARGERVRKMLVQEAEEEGREIAVEVLEMELGRLDSVKRAAEEFRGRSEKLNVLVNNAG